MGTVRSVQQIQFSWRTLLLALLAVFLLFQFKRVLYPDIEDYFDLSLPADVRVLSTHHHIRVMDWSVAWMASRRVDQAMHDMELIPPGFDELLFSLDSASKYQQIRESHEMHFPGSGMRIGRGRIFIGGPDGNSFVEVSPYGLAIYSRFET